MAPLLLYLIESSLCLTFLYFIYLLFLREDTFHKLKRAYLLASLVFSLIIPVLPTPGAIGEAGQALVPAKVRNVNNQHFSDSFEKIVVTSLPKKAPAYNDPENFSLNALFFLLYFTVCSLLFLRLILNFFKVYRLTKISTKENLGKYRIVYLPDPYPSFSFLNYIFLNKPEDSNMQEILTHELTHAKQAHSVDILFFELYRIFFWVNPFVWVYKKSLSQVHECLADASVLKKSNTETYQELLLTTYLSNYRIELAHSFNYSLIKFRIKMMTKTKSMWWAKYKIAIALPVIILGLAAFTNYGSNFSENQKSSYNYKSSLPVSGWFLSGMYPNDYNTGIDDQLAFHGKKSAYIENKVYEPSGFCTLMQYCNIKEFKGKRIKMTGYIKSDGPADSTAMWIRIDDYDNKVTADFDNMYGRGIYGKHDWTKCEIVFDVPETNCELFFGIIMDGKGKVWFDNVSFEVVGHYLNKTAQYLNVPIPSKYMKTLQDNSHELPEMLPANLDFEE